MREVGGRREGGTKGKEGREGGREGGRRGEGEILYNILLYSPLVGLETIH